MQHLDLGYFIAGTKNITSGPPARDGAAAAVRGVTIRRIGTSQSRIPHTAPGKDAESAVRNAIFSTIPLTT